MLGVDVAILRRVRRRVDESGGRWCPSPSSVRELYSASVTFAGDDDAVIFYGAAAMESEDDDDLDDCLQ